MRDVAFSCDDGGSDFLRVAVWSLLEHYVGEEPIRVNVFEGFGGHSAAHKAALAEVVARFPKATLRYHDVEPYLEPYPDIVKGRENSRWNIFTWTPILTPQILSDAEGNVVFAGRLGGYRYYDMDKAIAAAFDLVEAELGVLL